MYRTTDKTVNCIHKMCVLLMNSKYIIFVWFFICSSLVSNEFYSNRIYLCIHIYLYKSLTCNNLRIEIYVFLFFNVYFYW